MSFIEMSARPHAGFQIDELAQAHRLSTRSNKTFLVDRSDRALREERIGADIGVTSVGKLLKIASQ